MLQRLRAFTRSTAIAGVIALGFGSLGLIYADSALAATTRFVSPTGSDTVPAGNTCTNSATPCRTINRANAVSVAGDTVNVAAGTYPAASISKAISIVGAGPGSSIIDGGNAAAAVAVAVAPTATVSITGVTAQNGKSVFGGGIEILEGNVVLTNDVVTHNTATTTGGGGIGLDGTQFGGATLTATNVTVTSNSTTGSNGGGMFIAAPATLTNCTIADNTSSGIGGGIEVAKVLGADTPSLSTTDTTGTSITGNTAGSAGGGIALAAGATLNLGSLGSVNNNTAVNAGGIYAAENSTATLDGTTVNGNTASGGSTAAGGNGGGVFNSGTLTIKNHATLSGNKAVASTNTSNPLRGFGGGIINTSLIGQTPVLTITDSTINGGLPTGAFNATAGGGLAQLSPSPASLTNTTISGNTGFLGGGIYAGTGVNLTASQVTGNVALEGGGAYVPVPLVSGAALAMTNGSLTGNSAALGGGLFVVGKGTGANPGAATLSGVTVTGNFANGGSSATAGDGGAVFDSGQLTIRDSSSLSGNYVVPSTANGAVTGIGGAVYVGPLANGDAPSATISDSTITGGNLPNGVNSNAVFGGAIATIGNAFSVSGTPTAGTLTATNDTIRGNSASLDGGGLFNEGAATVTNTTFDANSGPLDGGNVLVGSAQATDHPSLVGTNVTITGNTGGGQAGGGVAVLAHATLTMSGGTIGHNTAAAGGGLYVQEGGTATLTRTTVSGNTANSSAGGNGGGVVNSGSLTISNSVVSGNSAVTGVAGTGVGGAIYSGSNSSSPQTVSLTLTGDTLSGNTAAGASALLTRNGSSAGTDNNTTITNSTITGNSATSTSTAGAIVAFHPVSIVASTIDGNTAAAGSGGIYGVATTVSGTILSGNTGGSCGVAAPFVQPVDGTYNLADPNDATCGFSAANHDLAANPHLGALGDNGGPTPTQLPGPSSAAINAIPAGTPVLCVSGLTDQRDVSRPQGAKCDIGAVEANLNAPTLDGPAAPTFTTGHAGSFTYTTTGVPTAQLSESGALPAGVTFVDNGDGTATLSGTPQANTGGQYAIVVTATNGTAPDATLAVTVTVQQPPTVSGPSSANYVVNHAGSPVTFTTTGFPTAQLTETGALPAGVTFVDNGDGTATLSGTPTAAGTFPITVTASNGVAPDATLSFTLNVAPAVSVATTSLPDGQVGVTYSASLSATGGLAPYTWSLASGALPAGLTLAADGTISGIPTGPTGPSTFTVRVSDSLQPAGTATQQLTLTINRGPTTLSVSPVLLQVTPLRVTIGVVAAQLTGGHPAMPLAGQTVVFTAGATTVCTGTTAADGTVECVMNPINTLVVILHGGVTATFAGSALWLPSSGHAGLIASTAQ
jgi:hypothetical protein